MRVLASRALKGIAFTGLYCGAHCPTLAQEHKSKLFYSQTGWTVRYPSSWTTASCHNCPDPHAAGVFVDFFPPRANDSDGWIIVEPLASKPLGVAVDTWLAELSDHANQNTHVLEERLVIDGQPALRVRYRTPQGESMEAVYVMVGQKTISIGFSGQSSDPANERLSNYRVFSEMLRSFRVARVPTPKHVRP